MVQTIGIETIPKHAQKKNVKKSALVCPIKPNLSGTSNEDMDLSGTPTELQEIVDIIREGEEEGLIETETEDVHLKNSGSEITFSQFRKEADTKARNFRTSTQSKTLSEEIVAQESMPPDTVGESIKMDPLEYYTSSSSSSVVCTSPKRKDLLQNTSNSEKCSESVLKLLSDNSRSKSKPKHLNPDSNENKCNLANKKDDDEKITSSSESVKVVSSHSNKSDCELINRSNFSEAEEIPNAIEVLVTNVVKEDEVLEIVDVSENSESILCDFFLPDKINNSSDDDKKRKKQSMYEVIEEGDKSEPQNNISLSKKNIPDKYFFKVEPNFSFPTDVSYYVLVTV